MSNLGSRVFETQFSGPCRNPDCSGIKEGEEVFYAKGETTPQHVPGKCHLEDPLEVKGELCDRCFMEKSVTGKCGCDE